MGVTAAALLNRLVQSASRYRAVQKPKNLPAGASGAAGRDPHIHSTEILSQIDSGNLQKSVSSSRLPYRLTPFLLPPPLAALFRQVRPRRDAEGRVTSYASPGWRLMERHDRGVFPGGTCRRGDFVVFDHERCRVCANEITFAVVLSSCGNALESFLAKQIHGLIVKHGFYHNVILVSSLVDVYGKCHLIDDARRVFDEIKSPNLVSWNVIVRRYLEAGNGSEALTMFSRMIREGFRPMNFTFSNALISCCKIMAQEEGRQIHVVAVKWALDEDDVVSASLLEMYAKCGLLDDARHVFHLHGPRNVFTQTSLVSGYARLGRVQDAEYLFEEMHERTTVSWNALMVAYIRSLSWEKALELAKRMVREAGVIEMDHVTTGLALNLCAGLSDSYLGREVHGFAYRRGFFSNHLVGNSLLDMYGKCGCLRSAELMFSLWRPLGMSEEALGILSRMQAETTPSKFTLSAALAACSDIPSLEQGKQIHGYLLRRRCESDVVVRGALVDMYSKCRRLEYARKVFDEKGPRDVVLWNSMILGYAYNGRGGDVPHLFESMQAEGISADGITFVGVLQACASSGSVGDGREYYKSMSEIHCLTPWMEHYECMIELLAKHGRTGELEDFIHQMPFEPTAAMWARISDCRQMQP
ncbi:unnamed protein product [Spirodela intermedia]|uniref:Uncharacterized protein n=1 Tax=Spirodela intermedia TaxID=51605 RepID=A0A7I8J152_SPIIN|nr:unnamed protein product [Spirodela intermedia]CAA6663857.1 unnamed protein product [Spirodela intermedia]